MKITPLRTKKITVEDHDLLAILERSLPPLQERTVVAITSKIVSICEGRIIKREDADKETLIAQEAEYFLPSEASKYHITLTIKQDMLIPTAGIDESNGQDVYILWPSDPQRTANEVRAYVCRRFALQQVGVLITDSATLPLRRGTIGVALAHSGFLALNDYRGRPDLFGNPLKVTTANMMEALAVAAVAVIGEGDEQTPLALLEEIPHLTFQARNPSPEELAELHIDIEDDLYAPLLTNVPWKRTRSLWRKGNTKG